MAITEGTPAEGGTTAETPRDGDNNQQSGSDASRNATDGDTRNGQPEGDDDLDTVEDPTKLREMLRDMRKQERRRNEGYNNLRNTHQQTADRLAALEKEKNAGAPLEERVQLLERQLTEERAKSERLEKERKDERTEADIVAAARRLNAADPEDVVRLLDRDDLQIDDDGKTSNAEAVVRALLRKKPHLLKTGASGGADGGSRGSSGKGDTSDMNSLLRGARAARKATSTNE